MLPNCKCRLCDNPLYRNTSQQKQSISGTFFCDVNCRGIFRGLDKLYSIPKDHSLFLAVMNAYDCVKQPEYLTDLAIFKEYNPAYWNVLGKYRVIAQARENRVSQCVGKTPTNITNIVSCFGGILISEIEALQDLRDLMVDDPHWESIHLKKWNDNDITYRVEYN
jgi:hypothetical protein